jgi:hypothetical protein
LASDSTEPAKTENYAQADFTRFQLEVTEDLAAKQSLLGAGSEAVVSSVAKLFGQNDKDARSHDEIEGYLTGFAKAVPLFMGGRKALAGTIGMFALDQAKVGDDYSEQLKDAGLGGLKGLGMKAVFHGMGKLNASPAAKGIVLGGSSRAIDTGLTRENYINPHSGQFELSRGLLATGSATLDWKAVAADAFIFTAADYGLGRLNYATKGALYRNPMLPTVASGAVFGASSGATGEILHQSQTGQFDPLKIICKGLIQGGVDALAGVPGGLQARSAMRIRPQTENQPTADYQMQGFHRLDREQLALKDAPLAIGEKLNGNIWLGHVSGTDVMRKPVIFRDLNAPGMADRFRAEQFAYNLHRELNLNNGALPLVERTVVIDGQPRRGYVQELSGRSFDEAIRDMSKQQYGSRNANSVGRLLANSPELQAQLQKTWVERSLMAEWDNHSHNQLLYQRNGLKAPNIDYALAMPEARWTTDYLPSFGKLASRVSVLNETILGQIANKPLAPETHQSIKDFVARYDNPGGRLELGSTGYNAAQIDGFLGRANWYADRGVMQYKDWTNLPILAVLKLVSISPKGSSMRYEQAQEAAAR